MESFQIIQPSALLSPYVKHYWFLKTNDASGALQRIIPNGNISLIFHRESLLKQSEGGEFQPRAFIGGLNTGYYDLIQTGQVDMICVDFLPYGARAFFAMPMNELSDENTPIASLSCPQLKELESRLYDTLSNEDCARLIDSFLLQCLYTGKAYNHERMQAVVQSINSGITDIDTLANISCLGYKQFKRVFAEYVGANPKDFLRVVRFQRALYTLQQKPAINFTALAYECGYYDQPHLIKDFKTFSGYTPSEYLAVCAPYSDYFS